MSRAKNSQIDSKYSTNDCVCHRAIYGVGPSGFREKGDRVVHAVWFLFVAAC